MKRFVFISVVFSATMTAIMPHLAIAASRLTADEQQILRHLEQRQPDFSISVKTSSITLLDHEVKAAVQADTYLQMDISSYQFELAGTYATFQVDYRESKAQYNDVLRGAQFVVKKLIKPGMDVYTKEKILHDYVVLNTAYDISLTHYTAYDALYEHTATCQGYAMLTYQLLKAAGIPNILISGTATNSLGTASHAWNEVDLNGKWYQLDTTWDDPVPNQPGSVQYGYFNLTTAQMEKDHHWSLAGLPIANTNYVQVLNQSNNKQEKQILQQTGLFAELPNDTYQSIATLQSSLIKANLRKGQSYLVRIPYAFISQLTALALPYAISYRYTRDTRNPSYALLTIVVQ